MFEGIVANVATAIAVTIGLTQSIKAALPTLAGGAAFLVTLLVGVAVTGLAAFMQTPAPATTQEYATTIFTGLVVGLSASGLYKTGTNFAFKAGTAVAASMLSRQTTGFSPSLSAEIR